MNGVLTEDFETQMQPEPLFTWVHTFSDKTSIKCQNIFAPLPVTSKHLAPVLNFIQEQTGDSLDLTEENVIDVAMLADFLDVADVVEECCE